MKNTKIKNTFLILQDSSLKSTVVYYLTAGIQGPASSEEARRVTGERRGWEIAELMDHQQ